MAERSGAASSDSSDRRGCRTKGSLASQGDGPAHRGTSGQRKRQGAAPSLATQTLQTVRDSLSWPHAGPPPSAPAPLCPPPPPVLDDRHAKETSTAPPREGRPTSHQGTGASQQRRPEAARGPGCGSVRTGGSGGPQAQGHRPRTSQGTCAEGVLRTR